MTDTEQRALDLEQLQRALELMQGVSRTLVDWAHDDQREAINIVKALIYEQHARDLVHARAARPDTAPGSLEGINPPRYPKVRVAVVGEIREES